jgi:chromosome segregation ATPase
MPIRYLRKLITKQLGQYFHEQPINVIEPVNILMEMQKENTDLRKILMEIQKENTDMRRVLTQPVELLMEIRKENADLRRILMEIQKENTDLRRVLTEKRVHIKKLATEKKELLESTTPCRNTRSCFKHRELCVKEVSWASHTDEMRFPCEQDFDH